MQLRTNKSSIAETFEDVRILSFEEKKEASFDAANTDNLLEKMLDCKKFIIGKTSKINKLIPKIEQITWLKNIDNDSLLLINDLISSVKDLHSSLYRQYCSLSVLRTQIGLEDLEQFKASINDLKELVADLESRFFYLPNTPGFEQTTKELSLI